jgi:hypothetical protein
MKTVSRDRVTNVLYEIGLDEEAIRDDYSGRFMYGDTCFGLVLDSESEFTAFVRAYTKYHEDSGVEEDDDGEWLDNVSRDSMGLSGIWYWRSVKLDGVSRDDDD